MPRRSQRRSHLTEDHLHNLLTEVKPVYKLDEAWLTDQRVRLQGALEVAEEGTYLSNLWEDIQLWWDELPYLWAPVRPVLVWGATIVIGIVIGRFAFTDGAMPAQPMLSNTGVAQTTNINLAELIRSGQVKDIDVGLSDDPLNPIELNVTMGQEITLTGSSEKEDILAALEYVLVKDPNPGQRLQAAKILGETSNLSSKNNTLMALMSALLTDDNPGVRLSVIRSLKGEKSPLIRDALVKTVLEDEHEGVRLAAVAALGAFLDDLSVRSALLLVSRIDAMENVRSQAVDVLSRMTETQENNILDSQL